MCSILHYSFISHKHGHYHSLSHFHFILILGIPGKLGMRQEIHSGWNANPMARHKLGYYEEISVMGCATIDKQFMTRWHEVANSIIL